MNPLLSIKGTIISGFVLAIVFIMILTDGNIPIEAEGYIRWLHYLSGVTWIGLLYYFNFVQVPAMAKATAEKEPGPAAIGKYVAPPHYCGLDGVQLLHGLQEQHILAIMVSL